MNVTCRSCHIEHILSKIIFNYISFYYFISNSIAMCALEIEFESRPGHVRKLPVTWGWALVFAGYSGFHHYLQLASHELATLGINVTKKKKIQCLLGCWYRTSILYPELWNLLSRRCHIYPLRHASLPWRRCHPPVNIPFKVWLGLKCDHFVNVW